jgi:CDP-glucose 4,6-dehydratase
MTFWEDRKVLVTGATGLLGSVLVGKLLENKADVVCLIRDWVPASGLFRSVDRTKYALVQGDITNQPFVERVIGEYEAEVVFHLAAQTIVGVANKNPISTFESNIKGTWTILESCRRSPAVNSIIVASSDKAYGCQELPYTEDKPLLGTYPYDVSKVCSDIISKSYANTYNLPVAITRCANFYGPGDLNWNRIVPGTIRSIIRDKSPVIRSDGKTVRDYLYIEDAADGYLNLAKFLFNDNDMFSGEAFNFASGNPISTRELVEAICAAMSAGDIPITVQNKATNEIKEQWLSADKAIRWLDWKPKHTLEEGLTKTIAWYREFLK